MFYCFILLASVTMALAVFPVPLAHSSLLSHGSYSDSVYVLSLQFHGLKYHLNAYKPNIQMYSRPDLSLLRQTTMYLKSCLIMFLVWGISILIHPKLISWSVFPFPYQLLLLGSFPTNLYCRILFSTSLHIQFITTASKIYWVNAFTSFSTATVQKKLSFYLQLDKCYSLLIRLLVPLVSVVHTPYNSQSDVFKPQTRSCYPTPAL